MDYKIPIDQKVIYCGTGNIKTIPELISQNLTEGWITMQLVHIPLGGFLILMNKYS